MEKIALRIPALLVGCAMRFDTLGLALPKLNGQSINTAINYLGIPDKEYPIAGSMDYVWSTSGPNPFTPNAQHFGCMIKASTVDGLVQHVEYDGRNGACQTHADRLKPLR